MREEQSRRSGSDDSDLCFQLAGHLGIIATVWATMGLRASRHFVTRRVIMRIREISLAVLIIVLSVPAAHAQLTGFRVGIAPPLVPVQPFVTAPILPFVTAPIQPFVTAPILPFGTFPPFAVSPFAPTPFRHPFVNGPLLPGPLVVTSNPFVPRRPFVPNKPFVPHGGFVPGPKAFVGGDPMGPAVITGTRTNPVIPAVLPANVVLPGTVVVPRSSRFPVGTPRDQVIRQLGSPSVTIISRDGEMLGFDGGVNVFMRDGVVAPRQ